ncbi:transposase [Nocardia tengchongensis]|uniref:transposase n=1 Tax=Nocardia tengchongensis TaxID=2055889 RepID=UPI0036C09E00
MKVSGHGRPDRAASAASSPAAAFVIEVQVNQSRSAPRYPKMCRCEAPISSPLGAMLFARLVSASALHVLDNYWVHMRREVREWCADHAVELVFLPTYSSWLNRIECEFAALRYFALNGTDHRTYAAQDAAIGGYIRWRNQHARPIRDLAVGSKIRRPEYLTNVA